MLRLTDQELVDFLSFFGQFFTRSEGWEDLLWYIVGLLRDLPRKNAQAMAEGLPQTNARRLQDLLTTIQWDERALNAERVIRLVRELPLRTCFLVFEETGFPKKGSRSVGVARQRVEGLGRNQNCQVAVTAVCVKDGTPWPLDVRLYLPEDWANDSDRRNRAGVPDGVRYQTRQEIALDILTDVRRQEMEGIVAGGAEFVCTGDFLARLEERGFPYLLALPPQAQVELELEGQGNRQSSSVGGALNDAFLDLREVSWRDERSRIRKTVLSPLRGRLLRPPWRSPVGWLVGARGYSGRGRQLKRCFLTNIDPDGQLGQLISNVGRRYGLEDFSRTAMEELGWGDYQGRLWTGFHRHSTILMLAYTFLKWRERALRRGPLAGRT